MMATEKRLIDANALGASISGIGKDIKRPRAVELACLVKINEAPTVDAVEVVRCKDCFANGCCSVQIDLDMGDEGYCPKGRKEN